MRSELVLFGIIYMAFHHHGVEAAPNIVPMDLELEFETLSRSSRYLEVEGYCSYFEVYEKMSLYGYNTRKIEDLTLEECLQACVDETTFICRSVDFNANSATSGDRTSCYLCSEDKDSIFDPSDFSSNINTNHYERECEQPEGSAYYG